MMKAAAFEAVNTRFLNSSSGRIGSGASRSTKTNSTSETTVTAKRPRTRGELQG